MTIALCEMRCGACSRLRTTTSTARPMATRPWRSSLQTGMDRSRGFVLREAVVKLDGVAFEPIDAERATDRVA